LGHPGTKDTFSGYGKTLEPGQRDKLVGLLIVDRPHTVDVEWLDQVRKHFGGYDLLPMTKKIEHGIACVMFIDADSIQYLRQFSTPVSAQLIEAIRLLLAELPKPRFNMHWDDKRRLWAAEFRLSRSEKICS
jgi:hypothetical protein